MTKRLPCPPAPGPLEDYATQFDPLFARLAQRRGLRAYLQGLLLPRDRNKTMTALAGAEPIATAAGGSFPADLGAELGEPGSPATALASAPHGAGTYPHHEPVASRSAERRPALQEAAVAGAGTGATGIVSPGSVGQPATA